MRRQAKDSEYLWSQFQIINRKAFSNWQHVYSASDANIESHLVRSGSARGEPRFSHDQATCLALLALSAESS